MKSRAWCDAGKETHKRKEKARERKKESLIFSKNSALYQKEDEHDNNHYYDYSSHNAPWKVHDRRIEYLRKIKHRYPALENKKRDNIDNKQQKYAEQDNIVDNFPNSFSDEFIGYDEKYDDKKYKEVANQKCSIVSQRCQQCRGLK